MHPEIYVGYTVYRNKYGPVWVALHSGPAVKNISRDDNSDGISSICWEKSGGTLILSNVTRDMVLGIDFNRDLPSSEDAISMYEKFCNGKQGEFDEEKRKYRSSFAFVAGSKKNYHDKAKIYKSLWTLIRNSGDFIIFIHRQYARLRNYPSAIDLITFNDSGIRKDILRKIVDDVNDSNRDFFRKIEKDFKNVTYVEQIKKVNSMGMDKEIIRKDMKIVEQHCDKNLLEKMKEEPTEKNFILACGNALSRMPPPEITMERVFSAEMAIGPKKEIIKNCNKVAVEVEINSFLGEWYPKQTAKIILEIAEKIRKVEEYKKMGFSQTQIMKFIS